MDDPRAAVLTIKGRTHYRPELMTACRIMQVGPPCSHPCAGCTSTPSTWTHDHWSNIERDGICQVCFL